MLPFQSNMNVKIVGKLLKIYTVIVGRLLTIWFPVLWGILNEFEAFEIHFRSELEAFDYKCEAFWRHFQRNGGFNKKSEAFSKIKRLFEDIFNKIAAF
jgi:hypothetical protein